MPGLEEKTSKSEDVKDDGPKDDAPEGDDVQHAEKQGRDPNTEGPDHPKMTGEGEPGSHSAVFGLTPDGKKDDNTKSGSGSIKPAHSKETEVKGSVSGKGGGVSDQMNDPKVDEGAHGEDAGKGTTGAGDKVGSGTGMTRPSQGTGDVKPSEPGTGQEKE